MLNRTDCSLRYPTLTDGLAVYSSDGEKLGKIEALDEDSFVVTKGFFFPKEFTARYDDILRLDSDGVVLAQSKVELTPWQSDTFDGWNRYADVNQYSKDEEIRVPVVEEELEATKTSRQAGEVRVRKVVHTELKRITIPLRKEEVIVERTPVNERTAGALDARDLTDETISVPVMEEEVEIRKRPVVKEEVKISKRARTEERVVEDQVKKQDVVIDDEDRFKKPRRAS